MTAIMNAKMGGNNLIFIYNESEDLFRKYSRFIIIKIAYRMQTDAIRSSMKSNRMRPRNPDLAF